MVAVSLSLICFSIILVVTRSIPGRAPIAVAIDRDAVKDVTSAAERVAQTEHEVDRFIDEGRSLERAFEDAGMG